MEDKLARSSKLRVWATEVGVSDRGVARLLGVSRSTIVSWRDDQRTAHEPVNWRERLIAGLEQEIALLRRSINATEIIREDFRPTAIRPPAERNH